MSYTPRHPLTSDDESPDAPLHLVAPSLPPKKTSPVAILITIMVAFFIVIGVGSAFSNLIGTKALQSGGSRVAVKQAEKITLVLGASDRARKVELCLEQKNIITRRTSYINCRPLKQVVKPKVTAIQVTIPRNFPKGRAVIVTRDRGENGGLLPIPPKPEKIALLIQKEEPRQAAENSGGGSGGGDSGGGGSGGASPSNPPTADAGSAAFLLPTEGDEIVQGEPLETRVIMSQSDFADVVCQEWKLDGVILTADGWLAGQSPDLSGAPCLIE